MSKKWILRALIFIIALLAIPSAWWALTAALAMRESEIPGRYSSDGAWGKSTLVLKPDHTFSQVVSFTNEYNGANEGSKTVQGAWRCTSHSLWANRIEIKPFIELAPLQHQAVSDHFDTSYSMMIFSPVIEVDPGVGIYYSK
jgi:hypothetical protein